MATFDSADTTRFERLDWQILLSGAVSLYHDHTVLEEACEWFSQQEYHLYRFDCTQWNSPDDFHTDVSKALNFPDSYGRNLDAFDDCLIDIDVPYKSGGLLIFFRFDTFAKRNFSFAQTVLDSIQNNARQFLLTGHKLITFVQSDDVQLAFEPVGACPIVLNPIERLYRFRQQRAQHRLLE